MIQLIKIISPDYLWKRLLVSFIVGLFSIAQSGAHQFYFTFENFLIDLNYRLTGTVTVKHIIATGFFDDGAATLTAGYIAVKLK